jgi:isorenieratene synthase
MRTFPSRIVVVGGGLAGLTAAIHLAERGLDVTLCESHPEFLGGRVRARKPYRFRWQGTEYTHSFDHGQHCMWGQYWNMRALLQRLGIYESNVRPCDTTRYLFDDGATVHRLSPFNVDPGTPQPSLMHFFLHMMQSMRVPGWDTQHSLRLAAAVPKLMSTWAFAHGRDYSEWDTLSIETLFGWIGLPGQLEAVFKSMCKASTFHAHSEISASWGLSMLESTMLAHPDDHKMWCFRGNLGTHLVDPLADALRRRGGRVLRNASAVGVKRHGGRVTGVDVAPTRPGRRGGDRLSRSSCLPCDAVVSAVDIPGFQRWMLPALSDIPEIGSVSHLEAVGSLAVRAVCARPVRSEDPAMGIFAGRFRALDTYFRLSSYQDEFAEFKTRTGGEVIELHSYLSSRELAASPAKTVRRLVHEELLRAWPELRGHVVHLALGFNEPTFDKQGVGHGRFQPRMRTSLPNLLLCGSWIRTDDAVHDMEKAVVTGLRAANALLEERGLATFPIRSLRPASPLQRVANVFSRLLPKPDCVAMARSATETMA